MNINSRIKDLPKVDRPREKLIQYGPSRLTNSELLAIILRSGKKGENVIDLAEKILKRFKGEKLPDIAYKDLQIIPGLGPAKACEIVACFELSKRLIHKKIDRLYLSAQDVWRELKDIRDNKKEHFVAFYLNSRSQEIQREIISIGGLDANLVHPREVFEPAVKNLAGQIILSHNHPSGNPEPSEDDIIINKRLVEAGKILGIEVVDHVIVTKNSYFSFKEKRLLQ